MKIKILVLISVFSFQIYAGTSAWDLEQTPTSEVFNGLSAPNNYFAIAVGENGAIVHFKNGDNGTLIPSGTTNELYDVYAVSDNLAVAAGVDIVLLWNGVDWQPIANSMDSNYTGLWITPEKDFLYYQNFGSPFSFICPYEIGAVDQGFCLGSFQPMLAMCGRSNDIKMVMGNGDIRHYKNSLAPFNGTDELLHDESKSLNLTGVYIPESSCLSGPFKPTNIFAINNTDEFYHFDGSQWNNMGITLPQGQILNWLDGSGINNIVAAGFMPNGNGGNDGVVWAYDGSNWAEEVLPIGTPGMIDVAVNVGLVDSIYLNGFETSNREFGVADVLGGRVAVGEEGKLTKFSYLPPLVADISVTKTLLTQQSIQTGDTITYQLTMKNNGPSPANSITLRDTYSNNMDYVSDNCKDINLTIGGVTQDFTIRVGLIDTLAIDESITCSIEFLVTGGMGSLVLNVANLESIQISDPVRQNNRAVVGIIILPSN